MKRDYMLTLVAFLALGLSIAGLFVRTNANTRLKGNGRQVTNEMGLEDPWNLPGAGQFRMVPGTVPDNLSDTFNPSVIPNVQGPVNTGNPMVQGAWPAGPGGGAGRGMGGGMCLYRCLQCGNSFQGQTNGGGLVGPNCPMCRFQTQRIR